MHKQSLKNYLNEKQEPVLKERKAVNFLKTTRNTVSMGLMKKSNFQSLVSNPNSKKYEAQNPGSPAVDKDSAKRLAGRKKSLQQSLSH